MPPFTPEQRSFLDGPNSVAIATQDGQRVPEVTRALVLRCEPDPGRVTVWLPARIADKALANLRVEPRVAIGVNHPTDHQTFQLKGRAVRMGESPPERQAQVEAAFAAFVEEVSKVGLPPRMLQPVVLWPLVEVEVEVSEIFNQTPGPGAGEQSK